ARPDPPRPPRLRAAVSLLAQLGLDLRFHRQGLGSKALVHALRHTYRIASNPDGIPVLGVVLDVLDQDALDFYRSFDFFLPLTENPTKLFVAMLSLQSL